MNCCKGFEDKVFDHAEGLLAGHLKKELEVHLKECTDCSEVLRQAKALRQRLAKLKTHTTSPDFDTVLRTRIRLERSLGRQGILRRPVRIPMYAAAGVTLALVAFFVFGANLNSKGSERSTLAVPTLADPIRPASSAARIVPNSINFPVDWLNVSQAGTPINSTELNRFSASRTDSLRNVKTREVQFEF